MISVVIPVYNAAGWVARAVESAVMQAQVSEVLLVEDGSSDDSYGQCQALADQWPQVRLLDNAARQNVGAAEARNRGWRAARGEIIAFLDADDFYLPGRFEAAVAILQDRACGGVYEPVEARFDSAEAKRRFLQLRGHSLVDSGRDSWVTRIRTGLSPGRLYSELLAGRAGFCHLNGLTLRRWVLRKCGGFHSDLRVHQDLHLLIRLAYLAPLWPGAEEPVAVRWVHADNRITHHGRLGKLPLRRVLFVDLLQWALNRRLPRADIRALIKRLWACYPLLPAAADRRWIRRLSYLPLSVWLLIRYPVTMARVVAALIRPWWTPADTVAEGCRIGVFVNEYPSTSETFVADHIDQLLRHGFSVWVFARRRSAGLNAPLPVSTGKRLAVHFCPPLPRPRLERWIGAATQLLWLAVRTPAAAWQLTALDRRNWTAAVHHASLALGVPSHFSMLHCHSGHTAQAYLPLFTSGLLQGPLAVTFHGYDFTRYLHTRPADPYAHLFAIAQRLYGCSDFSLEALRRLGAPAHKLVKIRNGVAAQSAVVAEPGPAPAGAGELRLLSVGRLVPFKGYAEGMLVIRSLLDLGLSVSWTIIGDGELKDGLLAQACELQLDSVVRFLGEQTRAQVIAHMRQSDLYLYTGVVDEQGGVETQGVALLEAQACGLPVVATRVGGVPETVADGEGGVLVPAADRPALVQAVVELAKDPVRRRQLGEAGQRRVRNEFNQDRQLQQLLADYGDLQAG